jgi:uncharacterized protein
VLAHQRPADVARDAVRVLRALKGEQEDELRVVDLEHLAREAARRDDLRHRVPQCPNRVLRDRVAEAQVVDDDYGHAVKQSISLVTLGVADYARAKAFYEALGWTVAYDVEETAFFQANGIVLTLWSRDRLAADTGVADKGSRWSGITLAHNVGSHDEVDAVIEHARASGAEIAREPAETFYGGYAGVFRDLDGHAWEVAHNPGFGLTPDGSVILPTG